MLILSYYILNPILHYFCNLLNYRYLHKVPILYLEITGGTVNISQIVRTRGSIATHHPHPIIKHHRGMTRSYFPRSCWCGLNPSCPISRIPNIVLKPPCESKGSGLNFQHFLYFINFFIKRLIFQSLPINSII